MHQSHLPLNMAFGSPNPELQDQIRRETARLDRLKVERPGFAAD